uniref:Ephrin RBD domain-containing protein n=1 Tax=Globodera rostochiensis TaxID=31243 RepID=A0A914I9U1_GLORO
MCATNFLMSFCHRLLQLVVVLCGCCCLSTTFGRKLPDIQWHSNNTIFDISNTEHVKRVHLLDRVTLLCPPPAPDGDPKFYEYSKLFMVSRESYDQCILQSSSTKQLGVCSSPERLSSITLVFRDVSPLPSAFTFRPGQSYFVITTSNGTLAGLNNTEGGLCATRNMRLKFDVLSLTDEADATNDSMSHNMHHEHPHHHHHHHHRHQQQHYHRALHNQSPQGSSQNESQYPPFLYVIHTSETSPHGEDGEEAAAWGQDSYEAGEDTESAYSSATSRTRTLTRKHCVLAVLTALIASWISIKCR